MNRNNGRKIAVRLFALRDFLFANADPKHAITTEEIIEFYQSQEFENTSLKTVYSDLHAIRGKDYKIDIAYDEKAKGWLLYNPPFEAYELRLIVDSIQASKFITQTEAKNLTDKITKNFGNGRRQNLNRRAYVYDRIKSQNDSVVKQTDRIHEAIAADRKIGFFYFHLRPGRKKEYSNSGKIITVSPYALYWNGGNLYLYAYDGKKFRYYRVDRMERITKPLPEEREGEDLFSAKELTSQKAKVFEMYSTEKVYSVKMRFLNTITDNVIDQFGRDIVMIPDGSDHFTITVPVDVSPPFYAWIATFGRRAKIVSPPEVVEGMKDFLQKAADMYKDDGNT